MVFPSTPPLDAVLCLWSGLGPQGVHAAVQQEVPTGRPPRLPRLLSHPKRGPPTQPADRGHTGAQRQAHRDPQVGDLRGRAREEEGGREGWLEGERGKKKEGEGERS